jgi:hypothetical protein
MAMGVVGPKTKKPSTMAGLFKGVIEDASQV